MNAAKNKQTQDAPFGYCGSFPDRVAVSVKRYAESELNGDAPAYWYSRDADEMGLECWRVIDGVDIATNGQSFDVWGASGWFKTVGPNFIIYLSAKDHAKLQQVAA